MGRDGQLAASELNRSLFPWIWQSYLQTVCRTRCASKQAAPAEEESATALFHSSDFLPEAESQCSFVLLDMQLSK